MNKKLALVSGGLAIIGLIVNVAFDLDNVYDMTTTILWVLVVIFALAGAFLGRNARVPSASASTSSP